MKTSDPNLSYGYQTRATHRAFDRLLQKQLGGHGLANGFWYVLRVLWEREGMSQRELADASNLTESSIVTMLENMHKAGFVRRRKDPEDGRRQRVYLTAKARRLKPKLLPLAFDLNAIAADGIDDADLATFLHVAHKMRANLKAATS
ncbi:MAG: MarR family transcriptional regulator [Gammaproteobacteria bacterium]|nr:MarR family transcriptional regulator [Gammaproteobacteria bacterium]